MNRWKLSVDGTRWCPTGWIAAFCLFGLVLLTACGDAESATATVHPTATTQSTAVADPSTAVSTTPTDPPDPSPSPTLPPNFSFSDVSFSYDEALIRRVTAEKIPAQLLALDGSPMYLTGVPDFIQITFEHAGDVSRHATMLIQPVRTPDGTIYDETPDWHREQITRIEALLTNGTPTVSDPHSTHVQMQSFLTGEGIRRVTDSPDEFTAVSPHTADLYYTFDGLTDDGIYLVQLIYAVDIAESNADKQPADREQRARLASDLAGADFDPALSALDHMIASLTVGPNASTASTLPTNPPGCVNDAEFVEDITVPDGKLVDPGDPITKTWRLRNSGTCIWTPDYSVAEVEGDAFNQTGSRIADIAPPGTETDVTVMLIAPETAGPYKGTWQLAAPDGSRFGTTFYAKFEVPEPPNTLDGHGRIEGAISYPAGGLPPMTIYFQRTDGSERYALSTEDGWTRYVNEVPVGDYYVFARVNGDTSDSGGGYTQFVLCGQSATCQDHALVPVSVQEQRVTRNIDIADWYAPAGSFPFPDTPPPPAPTDTPAPAPTPTPDA